jgi:eukaryotic translation initiation factor 2C
MVFGADVTHPSPTGDRDIIKSLAAVVGSIDVAGARYQAEIREQRHTKGDESKEIIEVIEDLEDMCYNLLKAHYRANGGQTPISKPSRIMFYRDGVSEGQFQVSHSVTSPLSAG